MIWALLELSDYLFHSLSLVEILANLPISLRKFSFTLRARMLPRLPIEASITDIGYSTFFAGFFTFTTSDKLPARKSRVPFTPSNSV
jgi:hypothetical protein